MKEEEERSKKDGGRVDERVRKEKKGKWGQGMTE